MVLQAPDIPTCFVISPIGSDDSEVRHAADDFLELLLEPVLTSYRFNVVRADRMATPTAITTDIVRLVQEAELCIIDLTGHNANVFYECGRRHETGRPFIQMVSKTWEERLPFDVAGIRTLTYDLTSARAVLASQNALRAFIDAIVSGEVDQRSTGASISAVAQSILRIERKLDALTTSQGMQVRSRTTPRDRLDLMIMSPREAWFTCMRSGDIAGAIEQLDRLKKAVSRLEYLSAMNMLMAAGADELFPRMDSELGGLIDQHTSGTLDDQGFSDLSKAVAGLRSYFINFGRTRDGVAYMRELLTRIPEAAGRGHDMARMLNSAGMLAWHHDDYDACITFTTRAYENNPSEPAYAYNLLLAYAELRGEDDPVYQQWLDRLEAYPALTKFHQDYLVERGRTFSGETNESSDDEDAGL